MIDTQVVIWFLTHPERISSAVGSILQDRSNVVLVSTISRAEIAVKVSISKLTMPAGWEEAVSQSGFDILDLTWAHARAVEVLPLHHRDPFDRLLVAQAIVEDAILVSSDPQLFRYPVRTLRASPS